MFCLQRYTSSPAPCYYSLTSDSTYLFLEIDPNDWIQMPTQAEFKTLAQGRHSFSSAVGNNISNFATNAIIDLDAATCYLVDDDEIDDT